MKKLFETFLALIPCAMIGVGIWAVFYVLYITIFGMPEFYPYDNIWKNY